MNNGQPTQNNLILENFDVREGYKFRLILGHIYMAWHGTMSLTFGWRNIGEPANTRYVPRFNSSRRTLQVPLCKPITKNVTKDGVLLSPNGNSSSKSE